MAVSKERSSVRRKLALIIGNDNYKKPYNKLNYSLKNVKDLNAIESTALSEIRPPVGAFIQYACAANQTVKDVMKTDHNTEPQPDRLLDEPWNEKKEGNLESIKKKHAQYNTVRLHPLLCRPAFDISFFDNKGNKTFPDSPITYQVGPLGRAQTYTSPAGWTRYGLKVLGKYSDGNYWLEPFQDPRNWYRAFHGTKRASEDDFKKSEESYEEKFAPVDAMASIYKTGFRSARVAAYGSGVYCSPDPIFPEVGYVKAVECDTQQGKKMFKCMLQVAVNPDGVNFTSDKSIWVVPNPEDIRPYGILIKDA
ncbi:unnamed protein product [Rotaria sordida]|uniref:Uncharacterized protein n=1 Tax=Rotaria sordida TaxID=392033 RepID=A0A818V0N0_9BILA|nr:unnamed protein product [Rotaria sordida]